MFKPLKLRPCLFLGTRSIYGVSRIGNREVVGHGINSGNNYKDDAHFPFPSIRFREPDSEYCNLKLREKCDWKQLSCEEKKALYRASFCQTFSEFQASTGEWKFCLGWVFILLSAACWLTVFQRFYIAEPWPAHFDYENQQKQLRRMLDLHVNPIDGLASKWDYEKDQWKTALLQ